MKRFYKSATTGFLLALLLFSQISKAQWTSNTAINTPVSTIVMNHANMHQTVSDGAGGTFVVWRDNRNSASSDFDIYAQYFNASGVPQWTANGVPVCTAIGIQTYPYIVTDGNGGIVVGWLDKRNGTDFDIYAQKLNASGAVQWVANGVAISTATRGQGSLYAYGGEHGFDMTTDGAGGAILSWIDLRDNADNHHCSVYAQRVNSSGTVQWTANGVAIYIATGYTNYPPNYVEVLTDGANGAFIVWADNRSGDTENQNLYAQRVNSSGVAQWTANGVTVSDAANNQYGYGKSIVSDGANGFIATWSDIRSGTWQIYAQRFNASGVAQWTANGVAITNYTTNNNPRQYNRVISDGASGAIISWDDYRTGSWDIYAQRVNASGAVQWTANGVVICNATNDQTFNTMTTDGNNGAIITWQDARSGTHIYAQRINNAGTVQWTANGIAVATATAQAGQQNPVISTTNSGGAVVVFEDDRQNIYYRSLWIQKINADGTVTVLSSNADLSALTISSGTLSPSFGSSTTTYTASVANGISSITVTPTKADANATIQVRVNSGTYATVASAAPSAALALNVGTNSIDVSVTAQDGTTIKTYTITVTRASAPTSYTAINNGNWSTAATWQGGVVPPAGADVIIASNVSIDITNVTVGNLTINSSFTLTGVYTNSITMNNGKTLTNNGTLTGTLGSLYTFIFSGSGLVAGSSLTGFSTVQIYGAVDFGTTSSVANLTINAGGSVNTNRPTYTTGSSLNYNTGGTYIIGDEWVTGNVNYPRALTINAGTTLSFGNITTSRRVGGVNDAMNINGGLVLSSAVGGDLIITSTYNNFNGTFNANGRTVTCLDGGSNCIVGGSQPVSFDNLVLNLPGKQFNLSTTVTVTTSATFTAGYTQLNGSDLIFNSGATITGASANCYVYTTGAGRLVMKGVGAGPVVAPIGRNIGNVFIHYNPVTITNGGNFDYAIKANATAPTGTGVTDPTKVIRCQWDITPSGNATNVGLKFQYITGQGVSGGSFSETSAQKGLHYNSTTSSWESIGAATPVGSNPYTVSYTYSGPTWSPFSLENTGSVPVSITGLKAFQKNNGVQVEWNSANETNMASYELEKSIDGAVFSKAGTVVAIGSSSYNWCDASPVNGNNYYRIKMLDKNGKFTYTLVVNVKIGGIKNTFAVIGNPVRNKTIALQMTNLEKGIYTVNVFNNLGQKVASKIISHAEGSATETIALGNVEKGTYQLSIIGSNVKETRTIIVE